jgi:hypothetical protein
MQAGTCRKSAIGRRVAKSKAQVEGYEESMKLAVSFWISPDLGLAF